MKKEAALSSSAVLGDRCIGRGTQARIDSSTVSERDGANVVAAEIWRRRHNARLPFVVGMGGSVAVGKSTLAAAVAERLVLDHNSEVTVIGTDGFLFANVELVARNLLDRKGEPDTYDEAALLAFIAQIRRGTTTVSVPTYSHRTFDVTAPIPKRVGDLVIIEGVNALQPGLVDAYDFAIYLDADETTIERWFTERFLGLVDSAEHDEASFYRRFVPQSPDERRETAAWVWSTINGPNLTRFVLPSKAAAHLVVHLDADHQVTAVDNSEIRPRTW